MICPPDTDLTYKDFTISIGQCPIGACDFEIVKHVQGMRFCLFKDEELFSSTDEAVYNACQIIETNGEQFAEKFKEMFKSFCNDVLRNSKWFYLEQTEINTLYFIKMKYKLDQLAINNN